MLLLNAASSLSEYFNPGFGATGTIGGFFGTSGAAFGVKTKAAPTAWLTVGAAGSGPEDFSDFLFVTFLLNAGFDWAIRISSEFFLDVVAAGSGATFADTGAVIFEEVFFGAGAALGVGRFRLLFFLLQTSWLPSWLPS